MLQHVSVLHFFLKLHDIPLFIHSATDGDVGSCHLLTSVNNAALNICVNVFVRTYVFFSSLGQAPRSGVAGSHDYSGLSF